MLNTRDTNNFPLSTLPLQKDGKSMIYLVQSFGNWKTEVQTDLRVPKSCCDNVALAISVKSIFKPGMFTTSLKQGPLDVKFG